MAIPVEVLAIIIPAVGGASLHVAVRFFGEAEKFLPRLDLIAQERKDRIGLAVLREMEDDVERSLGSFTPEEAMGVDFVAQRRRREANTLAEAAWELFNKHSRATHLHHALARWEQRGQFVCAIGTLMNLVLIPSLIVLIAIRPLPLLVDAAYIWIAFVVLVVPTVAAAVCYLVGYGVRRRLKSLIDDA